MNEFSEEVWRTNYKYKDEQCIEDTFDRNAEALSTVEEDKDYWYEQFKRILNKRWFCPGGRILANAGTEFNTTLFNCYTSPTISYDCDSIEGIIDNLKIQALTLKSEGGWGENFSYLRPRGAFIKGVGVESPGAVKYMEMFNKSSEIITCGSGKESEEE